MQRIVTTNMLRHKTRLVNYYIKMNSKVKPNAYEPRKHHLNKKKSVLIVTTFKSNEEGLYYTGKRKEEGKKRKRKNKSVCPSGI